MGLEYPGEWKFDGVGFGIDWQAVNEFFGLVVNISDDSQDSIETFKSAFGDQRTSTKYSFALGDLRRQMDSRAPNAALFVDNLWSGIETAREQKLKVPSVKFVNDILERHGIRLRVDPPRLTLVPGDALLVEAGVEAKA